MRNVSESLAGRMGIVTLAPLLYQEINGGNGEAARSISFDSLSAREHFRFTLGDVFSYIHRGGMPAQLAYDEEQRAEYYNSCIATYLMKDAVEFGGITDVLRFHKFLTAAASQNTHVVNYADLAAASGITQPTAKEWLMLLEGMGIAWTLQPYFSNICKRLVKTPKLYFYRDTGKNEIDVLLEDFSGITPLEIKLSASPDKSCVKRFVILNKLKRKVNAGGIVCLAENLLPIDSGNSVIPVGCI